MSKKIEFKESEQGHRITMPIDSLNYAERVLQIPSLVFGWFGPCARFDEVPVNLPSGKPFEAKLVRIMAKSKPYSLNELMTALEQVDFRIDQDGRGPYQLGNIAQLIAFLSAHQEILRSSMDAVLALGSVVSKHGHMYIPGAKQGADETGSFITLFDRARIPQEPLTKAKGVSYSLLIVRDADLIDFSDMCPGCA